MTLPDGRSVILSPGILVEPTPVEGRVVFWLPGANRDGYRHWERIGSVPHADLAIERGFCTLRATSLPVRQWTGGRWKNLLRRPGGEQSWTLPDGGSAEPCGPRRSDLLLVWPEDDSTAVDPGRIRSIWPGIEDARPIGLNLYLVSGIEAVKSPVTPASGPDMAPADSPRGRAERALAEAREARDPRRTAMSLADLGLACLQSEDLRRGEGLMEEAWLEARRSGDGELETNILIDLGLANLSSGRLVRAREVLGSALANARATGHRFAEKAALDRLGQAFMVQGEPALALDHFERSLSMAVDLGDAHHQAELMWRIGLQHAELGRRDRALVMARAAVDRMRRQGKPQAEWYAHHLGLYRDGDPATPPGSPAGAGPTPSWASGPDPKDVRGPGALRMALTAIGSMAKFLGSGFKATTPEVYSERLGACTLCEHHTGLRCRLCGCFTAAKAHLLYERCPIGRWSE